MREELKSKRKKKEGWEGKGTGVEWGWGGWGEGADGYCKLNWLSQGSGFHCDKSE